MVIDRVGSVKWGGGGGRGREEKRRVFILLCSSVHIFIWKREKKLTGLIRIDLIRLD